MPVNAEKRRCQIPGCRAWAVRGGEQCASHAGLARGGATVGNRNATRHGLYSQYFTDAELRTLLSAEPAGVGDEIALCRVLTGRLMSALQAANGCDELVTIAGLALRSAAVTARLLQTNRVLTGDSGDDLASAIGSVLDQLSAHWNVQL